MNAGSKETADDCGNPLCGGACRAVLSRPRRSVTVAALYVDPAGVYAGLPGVEVWGESRDARTYPGPHPVVAHPPCARWGSLAYVNQAMHGYRVGDDGGCFAAALAAVRRFGGVLEHPANSLAWTEFDLPRPARGGWSQSLTDSGWATEVSQVTYGHRARKRTWLYYVGDTPPAGLDWRDGDGECIVGDLWHGNGRRLGRGDRPRMYQREALATPEAFRDVLLELARSSRPLVHPASGRMIPWHEHVIAESPYHDATTLRVCTVEGCWFSEVVEPASGGAA